jgi:hypothetical protein
MIRMWCPTVPAAGSFATSGVVTVIVKFVGVSTTDGPEASEGSATWVSP